MVFRRLVLASASPARLGLLRAAGLDPEVVVSGVSEDDIDEPDVRRLTALLAERKARAVVVAVTTVSAAGAGSGRTGASPSGSDAGGADAGRSDPGGVIVIGCDSLLELEGRPFGKPREPDVAAARWRALRGCEARLHTGHHLVDTASGREAAAVGTTVIRFAEPDDAEIAAYVATGEPLHVAGGFTLDGRGAPFVAGIDGCPGNVIGLSLPLLRRLLAELGIGIVDLWS